jgi:hypothetical protein
VAGAPADDFMATLLTAVLHPNRLLRSMQIEQSNDRTQSEAAVHCCFSSGSNAAAVAVGPRQAPSARSRSLCSHRAPTPAAAPVAGIQGTADVAGVGGGPAPQVPGQ